MATKTFQTRIKLKYDLQSKWNDSFAPLVGEMLLGHDTINNETRVFANVGVGTAAGEFKPLSIRTNNVWLNDETTLTAKLTAIDTALGTSGSVADQINTTIAGLQVDAFELAKVDAGNIVISGISEANGEIAAASTKDFTIAVEGLYSSSNPLVAKSYVEGINTTLTNNINTKANQSDLTALTTRVTTAEGKITTLEGKAINNTAEDNWVSVDLTNNILTVNHKDVEINESTGTAVEVGEGSISRSFTIPNLAFDNKGHVTNFGTTTITVNTPNASELGLSNALHFIGTVEFNPAEEGATTENYKQGDVVLFGDLEYVLSGEGEDATWVELGNASANATAIAALQGLVGNTAVATQISTAIGNLDSAVTAKDNDTTIPANNIYVPATDTFNVLEKLTITDGLLVPGSSSAVTLKRLAATGAAADVSITDTGGLISATNVEDALAEIVGKVNTNTTSISNLNTSVTSQIENAINNLDVTAQTIAKQEGNKVTLSKTITQTDGKIAIGQQDNTIDLADVATTGAAADVSYNGSNNQIISKTNVQEAIDDIESKLVEQDTNINNHSTAIDKLNDNDTVVGSVANSIKTAINALDSSATIATNNGGVVTLKAGITETDGKVGNSGDADITLAKVATTGNTDDLEQGLIFVFDCGSATTVIDGQANVQSNA